MKGSEDLILIIYSWLIFIDFKKNSFKLMVLLNFPLYIQLKIVDQKVQMRILMTQIQQ